MQLWGGGEGKFLCNYKEEGGGAAPTTTEKKDVLSTKG